MPSSTDSPDRQSGKLPPILLWAGVGVALLAALALVVGSGERSLRVATGLALLAVVLMGLSIALRPTVESVKADLEETLYEEVGGVREGMRKDIATAARATHRSFGERFEHLQAALEHLRGQVEALRAEFARQPHAMAPGGVGPGMSGPPRPAGAVPQGVVRHTETVQVTTRSTIVDPHAEEQHPGRGPAWSGQAPRRSTDNVYGTRTEPAPSYEESWTEQQLRKRLAEAEASRNESPSPDEGDRWSGLRSGDRWASVRADDRGRELRMGERRTSMHADESGTEVRYEDRWATVRRDSPEDRRRPADGRWSHSRDSDDERRADDRRGDRLDDRRLDGWRSDERLLDDGRPDDRGRDSWRIDDLRADDHRGTAYGYGDSRGVRDWDGRSWDARESGSENRPRALPSTSDEPSASEWVNRWSAPEPQRRRYADDY